MRAYAHPGGNIAFGFSGGSATDRETLLHAIRHNVSRYRSSLLEHLHLTLCPPAAAMISDEAPQFSFVDVERAILSYRSPMCPSDAYLAATAPPLGIDLWSAAAAQSAPASAPPPLTNSAAGPVRTRGKLAEDMRSIGMNTEPVIFASTGSTDGSTDDTLLPSPPPRSAITPMPPVLSPGSPMRGAGDGPPSPDIPVASEVEHLRDRVAKMIRERADLELRVTNMRKEMQALRANQARATTNGANGGSASAPQRSKSETGIPPSSAPSAACGADLPQLLCVANTGLAKENQASQATTTASGHFRAHRISGTLKARLSQHIRELRSRLAVIRTGVRSWASVETLAPFAASLTHVAAQNQGQFQRVTDRNEYFEKTLLNLQSRLLAMPDDDCPEGYEVRRNGPANGAARAPAHSQDARAFNEFCTALTHSLEMKLGKIETFTQRGARALQQTAALQSDRTAAITASESRIGKLESVCADWECLAVAMSVDSVFETVSVQACRKLEFASLHKSVTEANDEIRVACGVTDWHAKQQPRLKVAGWRERRLEALCRLEQLLSQELQHFMMNGPQRNFLRRKVLLMRELCALLRRLDTSTAAMQGTTASFALDPPSMLSLNSSGANAAIVGRANRKASGPLANGGMETRAQLTGGGGSQLSTPVRTTSERPPSDGNSSDGDGGSNPMAAGLHRGASTPTLPKVVGIR